MSFFQALLTTLGLPGIQANTIALTAVDTTTFSLSWVNGNGRARIVVIKAGYTVDSPPVNNTTYTASTTFGSGTQIGTGNYVVFNGTGNTVSVTGLTANTKYSIRIYEYAGIAGAEKYNQRRATDNPKVEYTFTTQYAAVLTRAGVQGFTTPVLSDQIFDNNMMRRFVRDGVIASADALWWFANSVQNFGRINWVTPSANELTLINSPTFTADQGITGNGTSSYVNSNYTPSGGTLFTQNNASFGIFVTNEVSDDGFDVGAVAPGPTRESLRSRSAANVNFHNINDSTNHTSAFTALSFGVHQVIRINSTNTLSWQSLKAMLPSTGGSTSTARPGITVYFGARHNTTVTDVADSFSGRRYGFAYFGNMTMPENDLYYSVIARYKKHKPTFPILPKTSITIIQAFGDSFTVGQASTAPTTDSYINQFKFNEFPSITPTNNALGASGSWHTVNEACQKSVVSGELWLEMAGQNDIYRNGSAAKTLNKIEAMLRVLFVNHYATGFSAAGASTDLVRTGNYTTSYNARAVGGRIGTAAIPGTTAVVNNAGTAGTVEYSFTGTTIAVQLISDSGVDTFGTCGIYLDGVLQQTVDLSSYYDNISDGVNNNQTGPVAFWYTGLSNTPHVIKVQANGDGKCPVDFFAPLQNPIGNTPFIVTELPYRLTYPGGVTSADWDLGSARKLSIAQLIYDSGFPVAYYHVNKYYDMTNVDPDNVHPLNGGHKQIASGLSYLFD